MKPTLILLSYYSLLQFYCIDYKMFLFILIKLLLISTIACDVIKPLQLYRIGKAAPDVVETGFINDFLENFFQSDESRKKYILPERIPELELDESINNKEVSSTVMTKQPEESDTAVQTSSSQIISGLASTETENSMEFSSASEMTGYERVELFSKEEEEMLKTTEIPSSTNEEEMAEEYGFKPFNLLKNMFRSGVTESAPTKSTAFEILQKQLEDLKQQNKKLADEIHSMRKDQHLSEANIFNIFKNSYKHTTWTGAETTSNDVDHTTTSEDQTIQSEASLETTSKQYSSSPGESINLEGRADEKVTGRIEDVLADNERLTGKNKEKTKGNEVTKDFIVKDLLKEFPESQTLFLEYDFGMNEKSDEVIAKVLKMLHKAEKASVYGAS